MFDGVISGGLQRAATVHAGVGKILTPFLTPRSSSLRHLRRVMRKQQKEADLEHDRIVATENIAPGDVVPSVVPVVKKITKSESMARGLVAKPSIRTVAARSSPVKASVLGGDRYTTMPTKMRSRTMAGVKPAGPRAALGASNAMNRA